MTDTPYILPYKGEYAPQGISPRISPKAFIAPGAAVIGDVEIGEDAGVWFGCVVRGDVNYIRIGARTNIQDGSVIHVTRHTHPTIIGSGVTIGHCVLIHGATLHDNCFIGMRATLMDGVVVESGAMVAAGALVTPGKHIPAGQLWAGSPAKYFRDLTPEDLAFFPVSAENYVKHAREYLALKP
ncbi:MAG: gamma carbonic anhydrase family protein [Proteobacteria bacterium]|nr:gamma carbonic anhydrase family protein [Pseudomonadota bacterium]